MTKDEADTINLQRAVYRFIADPTNIEKGARAIRNMRVNPPVTARVLPTLRPSEQKKLHAAIDAFWSHGNRL